MLKKLTYLWLFPPQHEACLHEVYPRWTTVVVIELLAWLLNCCVVTKLIVFSALYTQNAQTKNTVSSIRFSTEPERESFPFCYISQANISAITGLFQIEK